MKKTTEPPNSAQDWLWLKNDSDVPLWVGFEPYGFYEEIPPKSSFDIYLPKDEQGERQNIIYTNDDAKGAVVFYSSNFAVFYNGVEL